MTGNVPEKAREVVFFTPDVTDTSTIRRVEAFIEQGCRILVAGFRRGRYNGNYDPPWPYVPLGETRDGHYGGRMFRVMLAILRLFSCRSALARADVLYARNLDLLLLAFFVRHFLIRRPVPIVYEVLDVRPVFAESGIVPNLLRVIERIALREISLLTLSSPGFLRHYFSEIQGYGGRSFLIENKLSCSFLQDGCGRPHVSPRARSGRYRWAVGYCGLIRGQETFDLVARIAEQLQDSVLFKFHGVLTTVPQEHFERTLARLPNLVYLGPYLNPQELSAIYGGVDFAWAIDLEDAANNSRWLLPCRFYEAGYYGVPCLGAQGFEVGNLIEELGVGWIFAPPYEKGLIEFFAKLTEAEYAAKRDLLLAMPVDRFVAASDEMATLLSLLEGVPDLAGETETAVATV